MHILNLVIFGLVLIFALAGRAGKVKSGISALQARGQAARDQMAAYSAQMQADAQQALVVPPSAAAPINVTPAAPVPAQRAMAQSVATTLRAAAAARSAASGAAGSAPTESPGSARSFLHDAFADPMHARRAIILAEILLPPPALR